MEPKKFRYDQNSELTEELILDAKLTDYYRINFSPSYNVESTGKTQLMKQIHGHKKNKNYFHIFVATVSAAAIIGFSLYLTNDFTLEAKIDNRVSIIE